MPRPKRKRMVCREPEYRCFSPDGIGPAEEILLTVDEFEVLRLVDHQRCTHEETARQMNISRTTVTEIYESARYKVADSLVSGKTLLIEGGNYQLCEGNSEFCRHGQCRNQEYEQNGAEFPEKGKQIMRIAVTYENGQIFQHFGHTETFKIYDVEDGKVVATQVVGTNGQGHGALGGFLRNGGVDVLICGGIGGGAQMALAEAGVQLFGGVSGDADTAVEALLADQLAYNPNVTCSHHGEGHEHGHSCGGHGHGEGHSCGSHGHEEGHSCGHGGGQCGGHGCH